MRSPHKTLVAALAALMMVLALAAPAALAQSSQDGYQPDGPGVVDDTEQSGGEPSGTSDGEELPFTGLDLVLVAVGGASLLLLGAGMRRLTRAPDAS